MSRNQRQYWTAYEEPIAVASTCNPRAYYTYRQSKAVLWEVVGGVRNRQGVNRPTVNRKPTVCWNFPKHYAGMIKGHRENG